MILYATIGTTPTERAMTRGIITIKRWLLSPNVSPNVILIIKGNPTN
ncbi:hypothetical protein [endosymbiont 'TC1' of Trimyema compressum]|nr:hypothetical protein [endosymbiont 'TC1' of Trimyema compressum]